MKKILLMLSLICMYMGSMWGQINSITGNPNVVTCETWMYSLNFSSALKEDTNFIVRVGKYGFFQYSQDTAKVETAKKGTTRHDFFVTWGNTATNDAKIIAYKPGDLPSKVKTLNVKIGALPPPQQQYGKVRFMLPDYISYGETIVCSATVDGVAALEYTVDNNLLEVISTEYKHGNNGNGYYWSTIYLKLKAKKNAYTNAAIRVNGFNYNAVQNKEYYYEGTATIKIHPIHTIIPLALTVCSNQSVSYRLEPITSNVTWQPVSNTTLVSGQGTANATFKAMRSGTCAVKAVISYDGKSYTVQNSTVWAGITYNAINNTIDISSKDLVGSLEFGKDIKGATKFQWGGVFPPQYNDGKKNSIYSVAKKHIIQAKGMSIYVDASNSCETVRIFYNVTVDGQGGDFIIK